MTYALYGPKHIGTYMETAFQKGSVLICFGIQTEVFIFVLNYETVHMKSFKQFLHNKTIQKETVVPDEFIKHYPDPSEKLQDVMHKVPATGKILYQYTRHSNISKECVFWAVDLIDNGFETPGIIQLAGEDLYIDNIEFSKLLDTVFQELDIPVNEEIFLSAYILSITMEVLRGEMTAFNGFDTLSRAAIDSDYRQPFEDFYNWFNIADAAVYDNSVSICGLRYDNIEEWMHQFFEKLAGANPKYC